MFTCYFTVCNVYIQSLILCTLHIDIYLWGHDGHADILINQHHQHSFYEIQKLKVLKCYEIPPHSHMFDHTPGCVRIFILKICY